VAAARFIPGERNSSGGQAALTVAEERAYTAPEAEASTAISQLPSPAADASTR